MEGDQRFEKVRYVSVEVSVNMKIDEILVMSLTRRSNCCRKISLLKWLDRTGWSNIDDAELNGPQGPQFFTLDAKYLRGKRYYNEFTCLKLLLKPEDGFLPYMSKCLEKHPRPSRHQPVSEEEWWIIFGIWLGNQIKKGQNNHRLQPSFRQALEDLKNSLTNDRKEVLLGAISFHESELVTLASKLCHHTRHITKAGSLLIVDESILNSESKDGTMRGMLKMIDNKPHSRGYFFHCACQKGLLSRCVLILGLECKWSRKSMSMLDSLLALAKCEKLYGRAFLVECDGGYPASTVLLDPHPELRSRFTCSVTQSKVSGALRGLVDMANGVMQIGQTVTLVCKKPKLTAFIHRKKTITLCLVTNAYLVRTGDELDAFIDPKFRMSWDQVNALYSFFTPEELQFRFGFPTPDNEPIRGEPRYYFKYLRSVTGQDLSVPTDFHGVVSENSLAKMGISELKEIARLNNINLKGTITKKSIISIIVKCHPMANLDEDSIPALARTLDNTDVKGVSNAYHELKSALRELKARLLEETPVPPFEEQYTKNYGLQDRLNAQVYRNFKHTLSKGGNQKLTWAVLYLYLENARSIFHERALQSMASTQQVRATRKELPSLAVFCSSIVEYIAFQYAS